MKNIWILAGETSGDIYGARLAQELRDIAKENGEEISFTGMGGPKMMESGIPVKVDSTELGVVGIFEVTKMLFTFIKIYFYLVKEAKKERPVYKVVSVEGPPHKPLVTVQVSVPSMGEATATAISQHAAEVAAAKALLEKFDEHT